MIIEDLNLTLRAYNALKRAGIDTVEQIVGLSPRQLADRRGFGEMLMTEIVQKIRAAGYEWKSKADCATCLDSRPIISENGIHHICCLSYKKAVECVCTGKYYVKHPAQKNRTE